jgi:hypothetical protein
MAHGRAPKYRCGILTPLALLGLTATAHAEPPATELPSGEDRAEASPARRRFWVGATPPTFVGTSFRYTFKLGLGGEVSALAPEIQLGTRNTLQLVMRWG